MKRAVGKSSSRLNPQRGALPSTDAGKVETVPFKSARLVHEVKNRMSALLLSIESLEGNLNPGAYRATIGSLERLIYEMDGLVVELGQLVKRSRRAGEAKRLKTSSAV